MPFSESTASKSENASLTGAEDETATEEVGSKELDAVDEVTLDAGTELEELPQAERRRTVAQETAKTEIFLIR
jgi:hypothetical protein